MRINSLVALVFVVPMAGCAPAALTRAGWESMVGPDAAAVGAAQACCIDVANVAFSPLANSRVEARIDGSTPVRRFGDYQAPFLAFSLGEMTKGQQLELASYSHAKTGMTRFDRRLYLRPAVEFFDSDHRSLVRVESPELCWGEKSGAGAAWTRIDIPTEARYVLINPSIERPRQPIDTRRYAGDYPTGVVPPGSAAIIGAIADSRQTYYTDLYVGLYGLLDIEVVDAGKPALGRCRTEPEPPAG